MSTPPRHHFARSLILTGILFGGAASAQTLQYPPARKGDVVDDYHGTRVADPYRWLEDPDSPESRGWIDAENRLTEGYLSQIPERAALRKRLTALWNYPKYGAPFHKAGRYFFFKNDGLQNQSVLYKQASLTAGPETLLDPNLLSEDGTVAVSTLAVSEDGRLLAYGTSASGSDWEEFRVRDVASGRDLPDHLQWIKFSGASWTKDGAGFFYSRYPQPGDKALTDVNRFQRLYYHRLGADRAAEPRLLCRSERRAAPARQGRGRATAGRVRRELRVHRQRRARVLRPHRSRRPAQARDRDRHPAPRAEPLAGADSPGRRRDRERTDHPRHVRGELPPRRALTAAAVRARRPVLGRPHAPDARLGGYRVGRAEGRRDVLRLHVVPLSHDHFPLRLQDATDERLQGADDRLRSVRLRDGAGVLPEPGRHARADVPDAQEGPEAGRHEPDVLIRLRRVQHQPHPELLGGHARVARDGGRIRGADPAGRRRVRRGVARGGHAREEAERVRRLHRGGGVPDQGGLHRAREARDRRWVERRAARRRGDHAAARVVRGGPARGRRDGHAAVPQVHDRLGLGHRVRVGRQRGAIPLSLQVLAAPQYPARHALPRHAHHHRRPRRSRRTGAFVQVRRDAPGRAGGAAAGADRDRDEGRPRRRQADEQDHRGTGRSVGVLGAELGDRDAL